MDAPATWSQIYLLAGIMAVVFMAGAGVVVWFFRTLHGSVGALQPAMQEDRALLHSKIDAARQSSDMRLDTMNNSIHRLEIKCAESYATKEELDRHRDITSRQHRDLHAVINQRFDTFRRSAPIQVK